MGERRGGGRELKERERGEEERGRIGRKNVNHVLFLSSLSSPLLSSSSGPVKAE